MFNFASLNLTKIFYCFKKIIFYYILIIKNFIYIIKRVKTVNNKGYRHFKAVDPITKIIIADIYYNAKVKTVADFLVKVIDNMPFKIRSVQVDGGSEFMGEFEEKCAEQDIKLYVLPPVSKV